MYAVVLACSTEEELVSTFKRLRENGIDALLVVENDPPYSGQATVIGIPPRKKSELKALLRKLPKLE